MVNWYAMYRIHFPLSLGSRLKKFNFNRLKLSYRNKMKRHKKINIAFTYSLLISRQIFLDFVHKKINSANCSFMNSVYKVLIDFHLWNNFFYRIPIRGYLRMTFYRKMRLLKLSLIQKCSYECYTYEDPMISEWPQNVIKSNKYVDKLIRKHKQWM